MRATGAGWSSLAVRTIKRQSKMFCVDGWCISAASLASWGASLHRVRSGLEPRAEL